MSDLARAVANISKASKSKRLHFAQLEANCRGLVKSFAVAAVEGFWAPDGPERQVIDWMGQAGQLAELIPSVSDERFVVFTLLLHWRSRERGLGREISKPVVSVQIKLSLYVPRMHCDLLWWILQGTATFLSGAAIDPCRACSIVVEIPIEHHKSHIRSSLGATDA